MEGPIKTFSCPKCGAPIKLNSNHCDYCGIEYLVSSLSYIKEFNKDTVNKYINYYGEVLRDKPGDCEANLAVGICYLNLGINELALKYITKAVEISPSLSAGYYYRALALLKGGRVETLNLNEIKEVESHINVAIRLDNTKPYYYYFWAIIKYKYYYKNALRIIPPTIEELVEEGNSRAEDIKETKAMFNVFERIEKDIMDLIKPFNANGGVAPR